MFQLKSSIVYLIAICLAAVYTSAAGQNGFTRILDEGYFGRMNIDDIAFVDGGIVLNGNVYVDSVDRWGLYVCMLDTMGNVIWGRTYLDPLRETDIISNTPTRMAYTSDKGFLIPVSFFNRGTDGVYKLDSLGQLQFIREYPNSEKTMIAFDVIEVDSFFYIIGSQQRLTFDRDIFLRKLDWDGTEVWLKFYGEPGYDESSLTIQEFNGHLLFGSSISPFPDNGSLNQGQPWKILADTSGMIEQSWKGNVADTRVRSAGNIVATPSGDWLSASLEFQEIQNDLISSVAVLSYMDSSNTYVLWKRQIGSFLPVCYNVFYNVIYDNISNTFIVAGQTCTSDDRQRGRVIKYSLEGDLIWDVAALEIDHVWASHILSGVCASPSGSVYAAGYIDFDTPFGSDIGWVLKITNEGCVDTLCTLTSLQSHMLPLQSIRLSPNPVTSHLQVNWDTDLNITNCMIYDFQGHLHGQYNLSGTGATILLDIPSGIYVCVLQDNDGKGYAERFVKQ